MIKNNIGLVLEGGGMRGIYTAGVLDFFCDAGLKFPLVATASSGALIGSYYVSNQRGNSYQILEEIMRNPEAISVKRWVTQKEIFSMEFIFNEIPKRLVPFDFQSFTHAPTTFIVGTTDIQTGKPFYHDTFSSKDELFKMVRASSSLPLLSPIISHSDKNLVDGGVSDPIPIKPSLDRGYQKNVVILTRNKDYVKKGSKLNWFFKRVFKQYPELTKLLKERHITYNALMNILREMQKQNKVFIIQPDQPLKANRFERNQKVLSDLYFQGYREAEQRIKALEEFLKPDQKMVEPLN